MNSLKPYIAIWHQSGGCDYTIGCGIAAHPLDALNIEDARNRIVKQLLEEENDDVVDSLTQIEIYELGSGRIVLTPDSWEAERQQKKADDAKARLEAQERAEYERLKKKYESEPTTLRSSTR